RLKTDGSLAIEHAAARTLGAAVQVESVLKDEHRLQAVAQVFSAFQTPAVAAHNAIGHAGVGAFVAFAGNGVRPLELLVANAAVNAAIQGDRRLGMGSTGSKAGDQSSNKQTLFHV